MDATLSHMVTAEIGSAEPVDPFFSKGGAGTEVPVK